MRLHARALKYCSLALGVAALAGAALLLAPGRGSAHGGGYLDFTGPGSGYLEVPNNAALNPTSAITVEAWIYLNGYDGWGTNPDFTTGPRCPMLVGKNWQSAYALALGCGGDVMDSIINGHEHFTDAATIPLGTWTHVAMTWDGTTRKNFQDGVQIFSLAESDGPIGDTADSLRIGDDVQWDLSPNGRIDDVRIWNVARTQAEIQAGMNGVAATTPGLVADWTFDNGSLTDAASGLTGALVGDVHLADANATPTPFPTLLNYLPGDENCDGHITIADVPISLHRLAFTQTQPACREPVDDANCDATFDARDPLAILYQLVGLASLPQSCSAATPTPTPSHSPAPTPI
jgi:hypothetical protein